MKKISAVKIIDTDEVFLETQGGGWVPSKGGFVTYDIGFLNGVDVEYFEVEVGIFDDLPKIIGESFDVDPSEDFLYTVNDEAVSAAAAALGRKGGSVKSDAKTASSRTNGKKGGRPRKIKIIKETP